jgi:hypothetical protein
MGTNFLPSSLERTYDQPSLLDQFQSLLFQIQTSLTYNLLSVTDPLIQLEMVHDAQSHVNNNSSIFKTKLISDFFDNLNESIIRNLHIYYFTKTLDFIRSKKYETTETSIPNHNGLIFLIEQVIFNFHSVKFMLLPKAYQACLTPSNRRF